MLCQSAVGRQRKSRRLKEAIHQFRLKRENPASHIHLCMPDSFPDKNGFAIRKSGNFCGI